MYILTVTEIQHVADPVTVHMNKTPWVPVLSYSSITDNNYYKGRDKIQIYERAFKTRVNEQVVENSIFFPQMFLKNTITQEINVCELFFKTVRRKLNPGKKQCS